MTADLPLLLPCPFCGGSAHFVNGPSVHADTLRCECESDKCASNGEFSAWRAAAAAWNTRAAIAASGDQWRDISTAPKDGTEILVTGLSTPDGRYISVGMVRDGEWRSNWWSDDPKEVLFAPTHWQPLPALPKGSR